MILTTRQRVLLYLLAKESDGVGRTTLMKWLFLYSQCPVVPVSRYNFVPYKYGPYSFEAYRDLQYTLAHFVEFGNDSVRIRPACDIEELQLGLRLPNRERHIAEDIWLKYHCLTQATLLDHVYTSYPWYACRSELVKSSFTLPIAKPAVYTIGYEGRSIDSFFAALLSSGIQEILDVRRNAYSHKYGFLSHTLDAISAKLLISYTHIPELGIASELRKDLTQPGSRKQLFDQYDQDLKSKQLFLDRAASILHSKPTALLCFEADSDNCHRSRLAVHLSAHTELPIHHL